MSTPAKVNAMRELTEAADRHGWTSGIDEEGDPFIEFPLGAEVYIKKGTVYMSGAPPADVPVDLMTLLLAAAARP